MGRVRENIACTARPAALLFLLLLLAACYGDSQREPSATARPLTPSPDRLSREQRWLLASSPAGSSREERAATPGAVAVTPEPVLPATPSPGPEPVAAAEPVAPEPAVTPAPAPPPPPPPPPTPPPATPAPPPPGPGQLNHGLAQELARLINEVRAARGLGLVTVNAALTRAAEKFAAYHFVYADPFSLNHFLDGNPGERAWREGYSGAVGEILVTAGPSAQTMIDLWMNSPTHKAIIVDPGFREIGMGCYEGPYSSGGSTFTVALCAGEFGAP